MQTAILLLECCDQKGIVARVSNFIVSIDGNVIDADQHSTDPQNGHFFLRIAFTFDETKISHQELTEQFTLVAQPLQAKWIIHHKFAPLRTAILVSQADHCLVDLLYRWRTQEISMHILSIISNHPDHQRLAEQHGLSYTFLKSKDKPDMEAEILEKTKDQTDFLILARYMQILSPHFLSQYGKDIINIHHSFLPSFIGANPYKQAFERGVKVIGATAHFVTEDLDEGPIICQKVESVSHRDHINELKRKGRSLEKRALAQAILDYTEHRIIRFKNKTIIFQS